MGALPSPDQVVQAAMAWHFDEKTGSPFWLERARSLPFDPRTDIRTVADLKHFPNVSAEWRNVPAEDLIPRGSIGLGTTMVYESGGTTGAPKRTVEVGGWRQEAWSSWMLDQHAIPHGINWLHIAPTGPHLFGEATARLADRRGGIFFSVDLDPRWVKKCIGEKRPEEAARYGKHLLEQAAWVLKTQRIGLINTTPPLLEAIAGYPPLADLVRAKVKALTWAGTAMSKETRRLLENEVFPGIPIVGIYGNTMMGAAPQRPRRPGDTEDCVFQPFHPYVQLSVVDPKTKADVAYGQRGQILLHRIERDVFLPNSLERDSAILVPQVPGFGGPGVADVQTFAAFDDAEVIEGVY
jgi:hypothetical protein